MRAALPTSLMMIAALLLITIAPVACENKLIFNETLESNKTSTVTVPRGEYSYLLMDTSGEVFVRMINSHTNKQIAGINCSSISNVICPLPTNSAKYDTILKIEHHETYSLNVVIVQQKWLEVTTESHSLDFNDEADRVFLRVGLSNIDEDLTADKNRVKFEASLPLSNKENMDTNSVIKMDVRDSSSKDNGHKHTESTLTLGSSLVNVHSGSDVCISKSCVYEVEVEAKNIKNVYFSTSFPLYDTQINMDSMYFISDEIYPNQTLTYTFNSEQAVNWMFSFIPLESSFSTKIIPDPKKSGTAQNVNPFIVKSQKRVEVSKKAAIKSKLSSKNYKIELTGLESAASYMLLVTTNPNQNTYYLSMNTPFQGDVANGEIINFVVRQYPEFSETLKAYIDLKSLSGNPDLYFKDCEDSQNCLFTKDEIDNIDSLSNDNKQYYRFSDNLSGDDRIYVEMNLRTDPKNSNTTFPTHHYISKTNSFAVAVVGRSGLGQKTQFELSFDGHDTHIKLVEGRTESFAIAENNQKFFELNIPKGPSGVTDLICQVKVSSGDIQAYFSRQIPYPCKDSSQASLNLQNDESTLEATSQTFTFSEQRSNLMKGSYYIGFKATSSSFCSVLCRFAEPNFIRGEVMPLDMGKKITRLIFTNNDYIKNDNFDEYVIDIQQPKYHFSEQYEYGIRIKNVKGHSEMCIMLTDKQFSKRSDCTEVAPNGVLFFNEEALKGHSQMHIMVKPLMSVSQADRFKRAKPPKHYNIRNAFLAYEIEAVTNGDEQSLNEIGGILSAISNDQPSYFKYDFMNQVDAKYVVAYIDTKGKLNISATIDEQNINFNDADSTVNQIIDDSSFTLLFTKEMMDQYCGPSVSQKNTQKGNWVRKCTIRIRMSTIKSKTFVPYSLFFADTYNGFRAYDGQSVTLPAPGDSPLIVKVVPTQSDQGLNINISGDYSKKELKVMIYSLLDFQKHTLPRPKILHSQEAYAFTNIYISQEELWNKQIEEPIVIIKLTDPHYSQDMKDKSDEEVDPLNTDSTVTIFASSYITELKTSRSFFANSEKNHFHYYILETNINDDLLLTLNVEGEGDADLFVRKGKYQFPQLSNSDFTSQQISDDELTLTSEDHKTQTADSDGNVWYTIGVYSYQNLSYTLLALRNIAKIITAHRNTIYSLTTSNEKPVIFEVGATYDKSEMEVLFWSDESQVTIYQNSYNKDDDTAIDSVTSKEVKVNPLLQSIPNERQYQLTATSQLIGRAQKFTFKPKEDCDKCAYLIAVYPAQQNGQPVNFNFVLPNKYGHIHMKKNMPFKQILQLHESQNFSYESDKQMPRLALSMKVVEGRIKITYEDTKGEKTVVIDSDRKYQRVIIRSSDKNDHLSETFRWTIESMDPTSQYSMDIAIDEKNQYWPLNPGDIVNTKVQSMVSQKFFINNKASKNIRNIRVKIHGPVDAFLLDSKIMQEGNGDGITFSRVQRLPDHQPGKMTVKYFSKFFNTRETMVTLVYELESTETGFIVLELLSHVDCTIRVNTMINNMTELVLNSSDQIIIPPSQSMLYQLYSVKSGSLALEAFACSGHVSMYSNQEKPDFTKEQQLKSQADDRDLFKIQTTEFGKSSVFIKLVNTDGMNSAYVNVQNRFGTFSFENEIELSDSITGYDVKYINFERERRALNFVWQAPMFDYGKIISSFPSTDIFYVKVTVAAADKNAVGFKRLHYCEVQQMPDIKENNISEKMAYFQYNKEAGVFKLADVNKVQTISIVVPPSILLSTDANGMKKGTKFVDLVVKTSLILKDIDQETFNYGQFPIATQEMKVDIFESHKATFEGNSISSDQKMMIKRYASSGYFWIFVFIALLAIGYLVYWKFCKEEENILNLPGRKEKRGYKKPGIEML